MLREGWVTQRQNKQACSGVCENPYLAKGKDLEGKGADEVRQGMMGFSNGLGCLSMLGPADRRCSDPPVKYKSHSDEHLILFITPSSLKHFLPLDSRMPHTLLSPLLPSCSICLLCWFFFLSLSFMTRGPQGWACYLPLPMLSRLFGEFIQCQGFKYHLHTDNSQVYTPKAQPLQWTLSSYTQTA